MNRLLNHRSWLALSAALAVTLVVPPAAMAQATQDRSAQPRKAEPSTMMEMMRDCRAHMRDARRAADVARAELAEARRSGNTARMQKAMIEAEEALKGVTDRMGGCMGVMGPMGGGGGPEDMDQEMMRDRMREQRQIRDRLHQDGGAPDRPEQQEKPADR